jgi:IclR family acetate operon transcriptional repressor
MTDRSSAPDRRAGTLERGLAILDLVGAAGPIGASQVAEALGLSRSATYRILGTLREFGYIEWDGSERVTLGMQTIRLGMTALNALDPVAAAHAHLRDLARELGESGRRALPARAPLV